MYSYDFTRYASHAFIGYGALLAYDTFVEERQLSESYTMRDGLVFGLSTVVSSLALDVVSGLLPYLNEHSFAGMVSRPLINGIVYMWLYDYMIADKYNGTRDESRSFMVGAVLCLITGYLQNPISSLFGIKNY